MTPMLSEVPWRKDYQEPGFRGTMAWLEERGQSQGQWLGAGQMVMVEQRYQVRSKKETRKNMEPQGPRFMSGNREGAIGSEGDQQAWEALEAQACQSWGLGGRRHVFLVLLSPRCEKGLEVLVEGGGKQRMLISMMGIELLTFLPCLPPFSF